MDLLIILEVFPGIFYEFLNFYDDFQEILHEFYSKEILFDFITIYSQFFLLLIIQFFVDQFDSTIKNFKEFY